MFFLYHGPAFFQYQAAIRYPREYEIIAAALALAVVGFAVGCGAMSTMLRRLSPRQDWFLESLDDAQCNNFVLLSAITIIGLVALINLLFFGAGSRILQ